MSETGKEKIVIPNLNEAREWTDAEMAQLSFKPQLLSTWEGWFKRRGTDLHRVKKMLDMYGPAPRMNDIIELGSINPYGWYDAQYVTHARELEHIDRVVGEVLREVAQFRSIFGSEDIGRGRLTYKFYDNIDPSAPIMGKTFKEYQPGVEAIGESDKPLLGVHKDWELGMVEMDASKLSGYLQDDVLSRTVTNVTEMVADFAERMAYRGADIYWGATEKKSQVGVVDANVKGLCNWSGIDTYSTLQNFTNLGESVKAVTAMCKQLRKNKFKPPFSIATTINVAYQLMKNRHTYSNIPEYDEILNIGRSAGIPQIDTIIATPYLLAAPESTSNGALYVIAKKTPGGKPVLFWAESYPLWHYPLNLNTELGQAGKIASMGSTIVKKPLGIVQNAGITTN